MHLKQDNLNFVSLHNTILMWMKKRLNSEAFSQLEATYQKLKNEAEDWEVFSSFSAVPRYTGKAALKLGEDEIKKAKELRAGWMPEYWNIDQLGRALMILGLAERDKNEFLEKLDKIFISSDMGEAIALYQSLPLLPYPEELTARAAEGVRSNITSVFNAVALKNPYPADYMDEDAWNQIVLKALFVGSPLYLIQGIDERANQDLAHMLIEYAHERWSAGRTVSPELWRPVGPFIDVWNIKDLEKALEAPDEIQKQAVILALAAGNSAAARELLSKNKGLLETVRDSSVNWQDIGEQHARKIKDK